MASHTSSRPELLAPAGGPSALRAAIANGADAVYLGVDVLNARRGAENFTLATLAETTRFAHLRGVRVYLTANVVVLPDEMTGALRLVDEAWAAGVDAVIVQDLGLLREIRAQLPHVRVHSSTQINAHNTATIELLSSLGVSRVTLAREVSVAEIAGFVTAGAAEIESFVHGALCMCYSGQCLMSSLIGRRSANRGLCAQPCRLPYELLRADGALAETPGAHLLSPKDLAGIAELPALIGAGVSALKIEGRMKSAEYVALVTGVYRRAIDRALAEGDEFRVRDGERAVLAESFSRGFSGAYLIGERGNDMMSYRRPNNRGVPVGRVSAVDAGLVTIALDKAIESADTIEFWTSAGRFAQPAGKLGYGGGTHDAAPAGTRVQLAVEGGVSAGDRVFRVRNAALSAAASRTFADDAGHETPLDFEVRLVAGAPLEVRVVDALGRHGAAAGPTVEQARTKPVTAEEVAEHVGRLGGTPYRIGAWSLEMSPGVGVGFSALHRTRREALAAYEAALLAPWADRASEGVRAPRLPRAPRREAAARIVARVADVETARACLAAGADAAQVPSTSLRFGQPLEPGIEPVISRITHDREFTAALRWATPGATVVAGNLGVLRAAATKGAHVEADWSLNALNASAVAALGELGARAVWLSPELSGRQIADVTRHSAIRVGVAVYGRQEMMVTEHCILMAEGECDRRCAQCSRREGRRLLRDRKGYEFPVVTDIAGRSHLYNAVPLDLAPSAGELLEAGVTMFRLDLELESPETASRAVRRFRELAERAARGTSFEHVKREPDTTSGHYFRGVL